jgi:hypothetical protein
MSHEQAAELPSSSPEFEALTFLVEAYLAASGEAAGLKFLRALAAAMAADPDNLVVLSGGAAGARARRLGRAWLARSLTIWLARRG